MSNPWIPSRKHFSGIFIISLALLAYQVVLTRIFSVVLYYHYAFAGVSLAMLGLTVGADKVFRNPERFAPQNIDTEWANAAIGFAVSSVLLVLLFLYLPLLFSHKEVATSVTTYFLVFFVIPFVYGGICVTLLLTKGGELVGKLYAADLIGAALGCAGVVVTLFFLDPITIIFALALASTLAACHILYPSPVSAGKRVILCILSAAFLVQGGLYLFDQNHLRVVWAKSAQQDNILFERWNAFSRIRVIPHPSKQPFGWGYGIKPTNDIEQLYLDIDSDAGTVITNFNGDLSQLSYLADDVINLGYHIRPPKEVAVIGVGGGRDILSALYFGAERITGLELNPAIIEALTSKFADYSGNIHKQPQVNLINAEARSWITSHDKKFDLIQISMIDTWAATAAGGLTLAENKLYTTDAWKEFYDTLTPQGQLVVARWYGQEKHRGEFYRLISLAAETLKQRGIAPDKVKNHILVYATSSNVTLALSKAPYTDSEISHMETVANARSFNLVASRGFALDSISTALMAGGDAADETRGYAIDISAPTDNRPFFFYMYKISDILSGKQPMRVGDSVNSPAIGLLFILLAITAFCLFFFIIKPVVSKKSPMPMATLLSNAAFVTYFAMIGLGFMLVEISQMQRLMILLGHPIYGLSVVLFTLLIFGGFGSSCVRPSTAARNVLFYALALCLLLILTGELTPVITEFSKHNGIFNRIMVSILLLAPAAIFMGMMFPIGMKLSHHVEALQPWFWGINGAASVFASILGMAISLEYGIAAAFWTGVTCYLLCFAIIVVHLATRVEKSHA